MTCKGLDNSIRDAIQVSIAQNDLIGLSPSTIKYDDVNLGWVTFTFGAEDILRVFMARVSSEATSLEGPTLDTIKYVLDPDSPNRTDLDYCISSWILNMVDTMKICVIVEYSRAENECIASFLLERIESNVMFFDSSIRLLGSYIESASSTMDLVEWSKIAVYSSLTDYNSIYRFSSFKITGETAHVPS